MGQAVETAGTSSGLTLSCDGYPHPASTSSYADQTVRLRLASQAARPPTPNKAKEPGSGNSQLAVLKCWSKVKPASKPAVFKESRLANIAAFPTAPLTVLLNCTNHIRFWVSPAASEVPLEVLTAKLGYSHVNNFSRAFTAKFGYQPGSLGRNNSGRV